MTKGGLLMKVIKVLWAEPEIFHIESKSKIEKQYPNIEIVFVTNANEAISEMQQRQFDVIIVEPMIHKFPAEEDILSSREKVKYGLQFIKEVRKQAIPLIIASYLPQEHPCAEKISHIGLWLGKPFTNEELVEAIIKITKDQGLKGS